MPLRLVFCGTPEFALVSFERLVAHPDFQIEAVITQPDRPRGRGLGVASSPIKEAALAAGLYVYQPEKIKSDSAYEMLKRIQPHAVIIIAYGQIIPARLLEIPRLGWINLHASLLPKYRGAAPIQRAILSGERRTGVTTMEIDAGLDTGPILKQAATEIGPDESAPELSLRLAKLGAGIMVETLRGLAAGELRPVPQNNSQATLAPPIKKEEGRVDWNSPSGKIYAQIRAFEPWPGAFTVFRGKQCRIWGRPIEVAERQAAEPGTIHVAGGEVRIACGHGTWLRLESAQLEGRERVSARDFANGARLEPGERFQP